MSEKYPVAGVITQEGRVTIDYISSACAEDDTIPTLLHGFRITCKGCGIGGIQLYQINLNSWVKMCKRCLRKLQDETRRKQRIAGSKWVVKE